MMRKTLLLIPVLLGLVSTPAMAQPEAGQPAGYDDHRHMMEQLGIRSLRPGADANDPSIYDEATANLLLDTLPDVLTMKDGTKVTTPEQWRLRRAEILEDFEREIYGRIPEGVPAVTWEVTTTTQGMSGDIPTVTRVLAGRVDNSAYPQVEVTIQASFTVPADATEPVPIVFEFGGFFGGFGGGGFAGRGGFGGRGGMPGGMPGGAPGGGPMSWTDMAIANGWGYGYINPNSIQPDSYRLDQGIIGLTNKGQPRTPDQWGALRAWGWGVSRLIDFFEANPEMMVDATKVGIEGVSRYGKAAIVAQAFDERVAFALVASSGQGGAKLHRRRFGEAVENLTGGLGYWMAGNYLKYGSADPEITPADMPVDAHMLVALCAPRPCLISYGTVEGGDPHWVDARGSYMAAVLAGPVYRLLGKEAFGTPENYLTEPLPPVDTLVGGDLAWRQHSGGHTFGPNWPTFFEWIDNYIKSPLPKRTASAAANANAPTTPPAAPQPPQRGQRGGERGQRPAYRPVASIPAERTDPNSQLVHQQLLEKKTKGRIDVYFIGDSITRRWGATDYPHFLEHWNKTFHGWNAANFAWGGDSTQNILWRLKNGELEGVNPKVIVVQAGTNNVSGAGRFGTNEELIEDVTNGIRAILDTCQELAPEAKIILTAIFPRNDNMATMPVINGINERIATFADGDRIRFININDKLADENGILYEGMTIPDKLHLDLKAYEIWAEALKPHLTELLGEPADEDFAPPPTGDPSAQPR